MNQLLHYSWDRAWSGIGAQDNGRTIRDNLCSRYSEPHRAYHTLQHLYECIQAFNKVSVLSSNPNAIELAIWFHDAVYDREKHNEERSADLAVAAMRKAKVNGNVIDLVQSLILITRHTETPKSIDEKIVIDVDLSILGASHDRFKEYEQQIRQEYSYVPDEKFNPARQAILQSFFDRQRIYSTDLMFHQLEDIAHENLKNALKCLKY